MRGTKPLVESILRVLRDDPELGALVGRDSSNEIKVYTDLAKENTEFPYVVLHVAPGGDIAATYGDGQVIQEVNVQISCWATETKKAWQLTDVVEEALLTVEDFDAAPWELMDILRTGFPQPLPDRDTNNWQVASPFTFRFSGPGRTDMG